MKKQDKKSTKPMKRSAFRNGSVGLIVNVILTAFIMVAVFILLLVSRRDKEDRVDVPAVVKAGEDGFDDSGACKFNQFTWSSDEGREDPGKLVGARLGSVISVFGMSAGRDVDSVIGSKEITEEFALSSGSGTLYVTAINVCADPVRLNDCYICAVRFTPDAGVYGLAKNMTCGIRELGEIRSYYSEHNLFLETDASLLYKTNDENISFTYAETESGRVTRPVFPGINEVDGIFSFEDGILDSYRVEAPELLYYALRNNVSQYDLEQMSAAELEAVKKQRDHYLDELREAFDAAGVEVDIDDETGTIAMKSDVLFDFDSYVVRPDSKEYINDFINAYASVLLRDDIISSIHALRFEGHTDTRGTHEYNKKLSLKRAQSVLDYCIKESSLSDEQRSDVSALAETVGYSYDYPVYRDNGTVDMDASRRVEINFVIGTRYSTYGPDREERPDDKEGDLSSASENVLRGVSCNPDQWTVAGLSDTFSDDPQKRLYELLNADTMCILAGQKTRISPSGDGQIKRMTLSDPGIGRISSENDIYYFEAKKAGTTKVEAKIEGGYTDGSDLKAYVTMHVLEPSDDLPLKLIPDKSSFKRGDNVKFSVKGAFDGDVWAFAYYTGLRNGKLSSGGYGKGADWIDGTTLSIDLTQPASAADKAELTVILTPAYDPDTILGYYRCTVRK